MVSNPFVSNTYETVEKPVQITGIRKSGGGTRDPDYVALCSCISLQYHYLSNVQLDTQRPIRSHSVTEWRSFRFSVNICSRSAPDGEGARKNIFTGTVTPSRRPFSWAHYEILVRLGFCSFVTRGVPLKTVRVRLSSVRRCQYIQIVYKRTSCHSPLQIRYIYIYIYIFVRYNDPVWTG